MATARSVGLAAVMISVASLLASAVPVRAQPAPAAAPSQPSALIEMPMQVSIVRLAQPGCEPNCIEWIAAQGRIETSTAAEFRRVLSRLGKRRLPILIDSTGGIVEPSYAIGRMLRSKGLDVVVGRTALTPCAPTDAACLKLKAQGIALGTPEARNAKCASSCAFILAGGVRRYVGPWSRVGLHEIKSISTQRKVLRQYRVERRYSWGVPVETRRILVREQTLSSVTREIPTEEKTYVEIKRYFAEMGVSETIMPLLRSAPNSSIRLLRPAELKSTGLATDLINAEQLLLAQPAEAVTAAVGAGAAGAAGAATAAPASPMPAAAVAPSVAAPTAAPAPRVPRPAASAPIATSSITPAAAVRARAASAPPTPVQKTAVKSAPRPRPKADPPVRERSEHALPTGF